MSNIGADASQVIKALYDYNAPADTDMYMSFSAGDFLHVVSRENDEEWYEACNPLKNERGLVPVKYFDEVGKTVRDSAGSRRSGNATHDSGYAEGTPGHARAAGVGAYEPGHRASKSMGRNAAGVYGIVSYDFHAERPDELDAKEGEAIIVIAQSNPEWFVAKPITRLGGPGLIPVSFIEIRDMTTGQIVADPLEAVQKAGIPRVEEWKKMAAEYKNTSIPLGTVSSSQQIQNMQQGMERMSMGNGQSNGYGHDRPYGYPQQQQALYSPVRAAVPRYEYAEDKFHFIVECKLSNGAHWDLSRIYEDFYQLQIHLISAFPEEAGKCPPIERTLPFMPGPVQFVTDTISEGRRSSLNEYLRELLALDPKFAASPIVRSFFAPRPGDREVDPSVVDLNEHARPEPGIARHSGVPQGQVPNGVQQQQQPQGANGQSHQRQQSSLAGPTFAQLGHDRNPSSSSQQPQNQPQQSNGAPAPIPPSTAPVKVKAWFDRDTCVVIRMPPRGQFNFEQLYQRIVERRRLEYKGQDQDDESLDIEYRDEKDGEYYRLEGDEDLDIAVERNEKLTLAVRATGK